MVCFVTYYRFLIAKHIVINPIMFRLMCISRSVFHTDFRLWPVASDWSVSQGPTKVRVFLQMANQEAVMVTFSLHAYTKGSKDWFQSYLCIQVYWHSNVYSQLLDSDLFKVWSSQILLRNCLFPPFSLSVPTCSRSSKSKVTWLGISSHMTLPQDVSG